MVEMGWVGTSLQLQLGPPPVPPLGVVADRVAGPHADPLGNRPVALQLLGQLALDLERLQGRLEEQRERSEVKFGLGMTRMNVGAVVRLSFARSTAESKGKSRSFEWCN